MKNKYFLVACNQLLIIAINTIGIIGCGLILYGIAFTETKSKWLFLDNLADSLSIYATLVGTILTAASIYFPENTRPPDPGSKVFTAPIVIGAVFIALLFLWCNKSHRLPPHVINGFSLLAISGALFRLLSRKL